MTENLSPDTDVPETVDRPSVDDLDTGNDRSVESLPDWAQRMIRDLRQESGKHRTEAKAAAEELDTVKSTLTEIRRKEALAGLDGVLADPDDLGRFVDLDELVDDNGAPDAEKYLESARNLVESKPHLGPRRPTRSGSEMGAGIVYSSSGSDDDSEMIGRRDFVDLIRGD